MQGTGQPKPIWYRDAALCTGMFDQKTRAKDILRYKQLPEDLIAIRVSVARTHEGSDTMEQGSPGKQGSDMHKHFICFGFSREDVYMMPGTPIHFYTPGGKQPARKAEVASMHTAKGRREGEKAILISFSTPQHEDDVSAIFKDSFTITEIDSRAELFSALQDLVKNYTEVSGDVDQGMGGSNEMLEQGLRRWKEAVSRADNASDRACAREDDRGMAEYLRALACVDRLRKRGVALNKDFARADAY